MRSRRRQKHFILQAIGGTNGSTQFSMYIRWMDGRELKQFGKIRQFQRIGIFGSNMYTLEKHSEKEKVKNDYV